MMMMVNESNDTPVAVCHGQKSGPIVRDCGFITQVSGTPGKYARPVLWPANDELYHERQADKLLHQLDGVV